MFGACSDKHQNSAQAPLLIGDSFIINRTQDSGKKNTYIGIKRESLEKEFLLQGEIIRQPVVAKFSNLKSRIVIFSENNDRLNMMEAVDGHSSSSSLSQNIILTQFKIIKEENGILYFDFSEGMSKIFITGDWYASDSKGAEYSPDRAWKTAALSTSYTERAETDAENNLVIKQIAQLHSTAKVGAGDDSEGDVETIQIPVEIKYYLSPYKTNLGFVSRLSPGFSTVGFFEIAPRLEDGGGTAMYATRWDERKPIIYSISANTPSEFVQAVKDGVLYWNKAFGKEVLHVTMAPKGVTAPDFHYNMIQWVDWKDAGYAYADAQMDPRTGEILHSSVFLTSVFGFSAKNKARQILRRLSFEKENKKTGTNSTHLSLSGFQKTGLCDHPYPQDLPSVLTQVLEDVENGVKDESALLKLAQDTITETVAHEVGHTLGLRHNFAGSLESKIPNSERDNVFRDYLTNGKAPANSQPSSSVMDYQVFQESLLTGDHIVSMDAALEYDTKAIQLLYYNQKPDRMPLFCTDTQVGRFLDCAAFDYGPSIFEFMQLSEKKAFENLPYFLMETYISKKSPATPKSTDIRHALPGIGSFALQAMVPRITFLKALSEDSRFLKAEKGTTGDDNKTYLLKEIQKNGGIQAFLSQEPVSNSQALKKRFQELLNSDIYMKSEGAGGSYAFSDEEKLVMLREANFFFDNLPIAVPYAQLGIYKQVHKFTLENMGSELSFVFAQLAARILETKMGTVPVETIGSDGTKVKIEVPNFFFDDDIRLQAAKLLNERSEDPIWGRRARIALKNHFKGLIDSSFKTLDFTKVSLENFSDAMGSWILTNRKIITLLSVGDE
jgi:hypothetical protein